MVCNESLVWEGQIEKQFIIVDHVIRLTRRRTQIQHFFSQPVSIGLLIYKSRISNTIEQFNERRIWKLIDFRHRMVRAFLNIYNSVFELGHLRPVVNKACALINSISRYIYDRNRVRYLKKLISYSQLTGTCSSGVVTQCIGDTIRNGDFHLQIACLTVLMHHS